MTTSPARGIFFAHNPKAGGSSVADWLRRGGEAAAECPRIENNALEHEARGGDYARFVGYQRYIGHYGMDIFGQVGAGHMLLSNFRDPLGRLGSLYGYFRRAVPETDEIMTAPEYAAVRAAKRMAVGEFLLSDDPAIRVYTENHHFRQLSHSGWSLDVKARPSEARSLVARLDWFFVCELPAESLAAAIDLFGEAVGEIPWQNRTPPAEAEAELSDRERRLVLERNTLDLALHAIATDEARRRADR